jgi:hypothetical protein
MLGGVKKSAAGRAATPDDLSLSPRKAGIHPFTGSCS